MVNKKRFYGTILCFFWLIFPWLIKAEVPEVQNQDVVVIGAAEIGADQDSVYRNAVYDAFIKAFDKIRPNQSLKPEDLQKKAELKKDLVLAQNELGITAYKVLRYWREQDKFYVEMQVSFGVPKVDQPRASRLPKMSWIYQTQDQITLLSKSSSMLGVWTAQTIEVIAPDSGKRLQWIKTGLSPHSVFGDKYLVQDGANLKLNSFKKFNAYNMLNYKVVYKWKVKLENLYKIYLSDRAAYAIERSGLIKAFDLENGKEKWRLSANSQVKLDQISPKYLLLLFPVTEIWMVNEEGVKLWGKKFEQGLIGKPMLVGDELFCLFNDGSLLLFNPETGKTVSSLNLKLKGTPQSLYLKVTDQKIFILYNDLGNKGHLEVYQRYTGSLLWTVDWEGAVTDSMVFLPDMIIIAMNNTIEARDPVWGLKLWSETINGRIKQVDWSNERILVVAGEKLYGYELR